MAQPRFLLVRGAAFRGVSIPPWPARDEPNGAAVTDGRWTGWRLLGGNNHELGRSAVVFPDDDACIAALELLRGLDLRETAGVSLRGDVWWWQTEVDGRAVAVSARGYQRQRECHYNLTHFLAAVPVASLPAPGTESARGRRARHEAVVVPRRVVATAIAAPVTSVTVSTATPDDPGPRA